MAESDETDEEATEDPPSTIGVLVRAAIGLVAVAIGVLWVVRLAVVGSTVRGGLLFELLAPLTLFYFGIDYLRSQRRALRRGSRTDG